MVYRGYVVNALLLNGLVPQYNNNIVAGGWYVGTLVLFYLLFVIVRPKIKSNVFFKYGDIITVLISVFFCLIAKLCLNLQIENNTFVYFNVLVQFPVLYLGMKYAYITQEKKACLSVKRNILCGLFFLIVAIALLSSGIGAVLSPYFIGKFMECFLPLAKKIKFQNQNLNRMMISISGCTYYMYLINIPLLYIFMPMFRHCFAEHLSVEVNVSYILSLIVMTVLIYAIGVIFKLAVQIASKLLCGAYPKS